MSGGKILVCEAGFEEHRSSRSVRDFPECFGGVSIFCFKISSLQDSSSRITSLQGCDSVFTAKRRLILDDVSTKCFNGAGSENTIVLYGNLGQSLLFLGNLYQEVYDFLALSFLLENSFFFEL
ncbi:hypothetical protein CEXT_563361 [Caerostris extrusa]|uniref:Uncharacterized protein n=1 Tax=Caerostris extrusa TaxID=172846 RepID=A0AAV4XFW8_CAEEX|nr:hypothetical protein CEXT_563361 [Caerostris extrusa]